jgi:hypothetical protein
VAGFFRNTPRAKLHIATRGFAVCAIVNSRHRMDARQLTVPFCTVPGEISLVRWKRQWVGHVKMSFRLEYETK